MSASSSLSSVGSKSIPCSLFNTPPYVAISLAKVLRGFIISQDMQTWVGFMGQIGQGLAIGLGQVWTVTAGLHATVGAGLPLCAN
jgi:hypothetical protein